MSGSNTAVTAQIRVELLTVGEDGDGDGIAVQSSWVHDAKDPLAVHIDFLLPFGRRQRWSFARTLLAEGLDAPAGEGDVLFHPDADAAHVRMLLRGTDGAAVFRTRSGDLRAFLRRTYARVPQGAEQCGEALDRWLLGVLDRA
ncbi:SsgA family sporulation/cell division regulator [Kitasatospora sp. NBC_01560]|uniref:SsgA family sporulation/cell division regulator n=1 Tax=Kitasatospora sp. NBC_01560 TaxID=2975965 RepID=UPI003862D921